MAENSSSEAAPEAVLPQDFKPTPEQQEILRFLKVVFRPGLVFEVRALGVRSNARHTDSGYYDNPEDALRDIVLLDEVRKPRGIYVTLNPVDPALLARSANRLYEWAKETTTDPQVETRRWLYVDIDPQRVSGVSATDVEKNSASKVAEMVREWLMTKHQFGEPVEGDSGNGRFFLWPIDIPNDVSATELVSKVLRAIQQQCGTPDAKIDTAVCNASRIMRVAGTMNRKGDSIADRPHRRARLVHVPDYLENGWREPVPREQLEAVAALIQPTPRDRRADTQRRDELPVHDGNILDRARRYLAHCPPAISGQGGHAQTFLVAQHLVRGFSLSKDEALPLLSEWNATCQPPWDEADLQHKLDEAAAKGTAVELGQHLQKDTSSTRSEYSAPAIIREQTTMPTLEPGTLLMALDRENFGVVVEDCGDSCVVDFTSPDGHTARKTFYKKDLAYPDGRPLISSGFNLNLITSSEFAKTPYKRHFLLNGILVEGQPCVIGGPQKSCKTSIMTDMAISLGCGVPFLGDSRFYCPQRVRTCVLSGESGGFTLKETALRICAARNAHLWNADILWGFDLPQLANPEHLDIVAQIIRKEGIKVMMIDPAYLCLLAGDTQGRNPANVFAMGSILKEVGAMARETGCTLSIAHHTRKSGRDDRFSPTSLEDLTMSGFPEWARQWLLIGRRAEFRDGVHQLSLNIGGSAGHSGSYFLTIKEGVANDDNAQRGWDVTVETASEGIQRVKSAKESAKADARTAKLELLNEIIGKHTDGETKSVLRAEAGITNERFDELISELLRRNAVEICTVTKSNKPHSGYRRKREVISRNESEQVGNSDSVRFPA